MTAVATTNSSAVEAFLYAAEVATAKKGKRLNWGERVELIYEYFPKCRDPDWNIILSDIDTLGEVVRDILRLEQAEPGKSGPRPAPQVPAGMKTLRQWTGQDHSVLPFPQAFQILAQGYSLTHLARKTHLSRSKIHRLLRGEEHPTPPELSAVAHAFGKEPSYFLEFRTAYIMAALGAKLEQVPEATIALFRRIAAGR